MNEALGYEMGLILTEREGFLKSRQAGDIESKTTGVVGEEITLHNDNQGAFLVGPFESQLRRAIKGVQIVAGEVFSLPGCNKFVAMRIK